jgi:hypothetical protein
VVHSGNLNQSMFVSIMIFNELGIGVTVVDWLDLDNLMLMLKIFSSFLLFDISLDSSVKIDNVSSHVFLEISSIHT